MKRKNVAIICVLVLFTVSVLFVSCDSSNENEITITVVDILSQSQNIDSIKTTNKIKLQKGEMFTWGIYSAYMRETEQDLGGFGAPRHIGFYSDKYCREKFDETVRLYEDCVLYVDSRYTQGAFANYCYIKYIYKNETYSIFRDFSDVLDTNAFLSSAYGKSIDENALEFYWDEDFTVPFDMENSGQIITLKDHWDSCPGELTVYVKQIDVGE